MQLKSELYRNLDIIGLDETLLQKTLNYVKRLVAQKQKNDETLMTNEEFFARVDASLEQARQGKVYRQLPNESFTDFRKRIGR